MTKIKRVRTIDAVVVGWRPGKGPNRGLADHRALRRRRKPARSATPPGSRRPRSGGCPQLATYETGERGMGDPSRWNNERELGGGSSGPSSSSRSPFDHVSNDRIRHGTNQPLARRQGSARLPHRSAPFVGTRHPLGLFALRHGARGVCVLAWHFVVAGVLRRSTWGAFRRYPRLSRLWVVCHGGAV